MHMFFIFRSNVRREPGLEVIFSTLLGLPVHLQMLISLNEKILRRQERTLPKTYKEILTGKKQT